MKYLLNILIILKVQTVFTMNPCEKCDIEKIKIVSNHIDNLTSQMLADFLCTFDNSCNDNAEYSEYSNETLFAVLEKAPSLFFEVLSNGQFNNELIIKAIENPVKDELDLQKVYDKIKTTSVKIELKSKFMNALIIAAEKSGQKIKK